MLAGRSKLPLQRTHSIKHPHARRAEPEGSKAAAAKEEVPFGYKNKDPYILGAGLISLGFAMYYGFQV